VSLADKIANLELDLEPLQRLHLSILIQARQDYATARSLEYIDEAGMVDASAFRFKGRGTRLEGGFSTPMFVAGLYELAAYWRSATPARSLEVLNIPEMEHRDFLKRLNDGLSERQERPSRLPLDTL